MGAQVRPVRQVPCSALKHSVWCQCVCVCVCIVRTPGAVAAASKKSLPPPTLLSRSAGAISIAPPAAPSLKGIPALTGTPASVATSKSGGTKTSAATKATVATVDASAVAYSVMYGKDVGSGTDVAMTNVHLEGLGVKLGPHVDSPFASVPAVGEGALPCHCEGVCASLTLRQVVWVMYVPLRVCARQTWSGARRRVTSPASSLMRPTCLPTPPSPHRARP